MNSSRVIQKMTFSPRLVALTLFVLLALHCSSYATDALSEHHFDVFFSNDVAGEFESCG